MAGTDRAAALQPFAEFISGIDRGKVSDEATAKLAELVQAVTETGGKGTLTIKVMVRPFKGGQGTVEVTATTDVTIPKPEHGGVFFFDQSFQLVRDDPSMEPMFDRGDIRDGAQR